MWQGGDTEEVDEGCRVREAGPNWRFFSIFPTPRRLLLWLHRVTLTALLLSLF